MRARISHFEGQDSFLIEGAEVELAEAEAAFTSLKVVEEVDNAVKPQGEFPLVKDGLREAKPEVLGEAKPNRHLQVGSC